MPLQVFSEICKGELKEATSSCKAIEKGLKNRIFLRICLTFSQNGMNEYYKISRVPYSNQIANKPVKNNWKKVLACENTCLHRNSSIPAVCFCEVEWLSITVYYSFIMGLKFWQILDSPACMDWVSLYFMHDRLNPFPLILKHFLLQVSQSLCSVSTTHVKGSRLWGTVATPKPNHEQSLISCYAEENVRAGVAYIFHYVFFSFLYIIGSFFFILVFL